MRNRPGSRRSALLVAVSLLLGLSASGVSSAPARAVGAEVPAPRPTSDRTFFEGYTVLADLEGGVYLQLQLVITNIGMRKRTGGCRLLMTEEGRPSIRRKLQVGTDGWSYRSGPGTVLRVGDCELSGGAETRIHARFDDIEAEVVLDSAIHAVRPLGGRTDVGRHFYESDILVPWAAARASVRTGEAPARTFVGHGYSDHARSTTLPPELAERWVRFRGLADTGSVLLLARFPSDGSAVEGWVWVEGERAPVRLASVSLTRMASKRAQWRIHLESVSGRVYELETRRELARRAPVEERGFLGKLLRPLVGNPVTYTYRAQLRMAGADPSTEALSGIAEVTLVDP